jgi:hypothetical protein
MNRRDALKSLAVAAVGCAAPPLAFAAACPRPSDPRPKEACHKIVQRIEVGPNGQLVVHYRYLRGNFTLTEQPLAGE